MRTYLSLTSPPPLELYEPGKYLDLIADLLSQEELPAPLIVADPSEFQERINEFGLVEYWNDVTGDLSNAPVMGINQIHGHEFVLDEHNYRDTRTQVIRQSGGPT